MEEDHLKEGTGSTWDIGEGTMQGRWGEGGRGRDVSVTAAVGAGLIIIIITIKVKEGGGGIWGIANTRTKGGGAAGPYGLRY